MRDHPRKDDRAQYTDEDGEYGDGFELLLFNNKDLFLENGLPICRRVDMFDQLMKSKLPLPVHTAFHVVPGKGKDFFKGMVMYKKFDRYRPVEKVAKYTIRIRD